MFCVYTISFFNAIILSKKGKLEKMNKATVDLINELSEIYASIRERVANSGELLESDELFIKVYKSFIDKMFDTKERIKND